MTATNERGVEHCDDVDEATLLCWGEEVLTFAIPRDQSCINDTHPVLTMRERLHNLADENAKLRELVQDMWDFFCVVPDDEPHAFKEELNFSVEVWKRMRELGIEVDQCVSRKS